MFFWLNHYTSELKTITFIEKLELRNFGHMTTLTISFESHEKNLLVVSWAEIMTS